MPAPRHRQGGNQAEPTGFNKLFEKQLLLPMILFFLLFLPRKTPFCLAVGQLPAWGRQRQDWGQPKSLTSLAIPGNNHLTQKNPFCSKL